MGYEDLKALSKDALQDLLEAVRTELARREDQEIKEARREIEAAAAKVGMTVGELLKATGYPERKPKRKSAPPRYRNPDHPEQTWSGRGHPPRWLKTAVDSGRSLEDFAISARDAA